MEEITNPTDQDSGVHADGDAETRPAPASSERKDITSMNVIDPNLTGLPPWEASDYAASITGSGAYKLKDSGVAPLVAAARGYTRIDKTNYTEMARKMQVVGTSGQGKRFKRTLSAPGKDGMVMPWYSLAGIAKAKREEGRPVPHTYQVRPEFPEDNDAGKPLKYEFISNIGTPLDLHPAIPTDWIDTTPVVMFAEGMLKGDSALSAYMVHNGISYSELRSEGVEDPVAKLRELLERIPHDDRVLIVSIGGVYNASGNAVDWREIQLKGRIGWIAFDADIAINPAVHAAANKLSNQLTEKSNMTEILYLNPEVTDGDNGSMAKAGVDDFLATQGNWAALIDQLDDVMPAAPAKNAEDKPGAWRVGSTGQFVEECVALNTGAGGTIGGYRWDHRVEIGGRVVALEARRQPTDQELKTGIFNPNVKNEDIEDAQVEIEVSWHLHGRDYTAIVNGPESILSYRPEEWDRKGTSVPRELLLHPEWPPRGAKGESWLSALKANRPEEVAFKTRWMQMGWVPVQDGDPVFLIGDQVVGDVEASTSVLPGISSREIDVIQKYGVGENIAGDFDDDEYREEARQNFRAIMDTYIHSKAWTDLSTATVVLAAALRPTIPIRPKATVYLWGPKGKGKAIPLEGKLPVPVSAKFPTGWALNSELELGDEVYSADGSLTTIRTFSDVFEDDVYEFTLSDGRTVRSSAGHLWKVSTAASRAARASSAKKATGYVARRAQAERLRTFAATLASGDAAPLPELVLATGFSRAQVSAAVTGAGIQHQDVMLSGNDADTDLTWVDLPVAELAEYVHGRTASFSELADVQRQVSEGKHYTSGKFGTVRVAKSRVYPVAETLAALADHVEFTRAPMPLEKTVTAETIAADFASARYGIRAIEAVDGPDAVLPVPAYTLGAWLGDGTSREGGFTNPDQEIIDWIRADGYQVTDCTAEYTWYIRDLMVDLREMDVLENKHIPARYLRGSRTQRLALLQGLMDTDGGITAQGQCELTFTNRQLAYDALELIRSFGIRAGISESDAAITEPDPANPGASIRRVVGTRYRIRFTTTEPVFRLARKAARLPEKQLEHWVFIEGVRKLEAAQVRCLTVEHPAGMFAQDDFVLSHNSWTAECMMRFWARHRGDWHEELPGSAKDTAAAMENAVARTPIWVIDDLAPSAVRRQAEQDDAKLADITRAIFNNATKLRMNADMTARKSNKPMTQLIMTGENELSTPSAKERLIPLYVGKGKLNPDRTPTDALNDIAGREGTPARFTSQLIKYIRYSAAKHPGGWAAYVKSMEGGRAQLKDQISELMKDMGAASGSLERTSTLAADVMLTFFVLENLARELDMGDDFSEQFLVDADMSMAVIQLVTNAHAENQQAAPGISLVKALAALLASGDAHVISGDDPSRPPIEGTEQNEAMVNSRLGWVVSGGGDGSLRPSGKNIGTVVTVKNKATLEYHKVVLFSSDTAFSAAQRAYPSLIQFGQGPTAAWSSVWDENLQPPFITRIKNSRGTLLSTWRKDRITGIPVEVSRLLDGGMNLEDLPESVSE